MSVGHFNQQEFCLELVLVFFFVVDNSNLISIQVNNDTRYIFVFKPIDLFGMFRNRICIVVDEINVGCKICSTKAQGSRYVK